MTKIPVGLLGLLAMAIPTNEPMGTPAFDNRVPPKEINEAERDLKRERRKAKLVRRAQKAGR